MYLIKKAKLVAYYIPLFSTSLYIFNHTYREKKQIIFHNVCYSKQVSLSDSRNQLKVKIKGPIANYTSTVAPLPAPTVDPIVVTNVNSVSNNAINSASIGITSGGGGGTSNLRRMRKKELLRQYWTQDMNMDEQTSNPGYTAPAAPPINRTIITIPKAVASMTSIPTKDDYRDYRTDTDDFIETKPHHRKESKARPGGLSRELRQLDLSSDIDNMHLERRRSSVGSNNSSMSSSFDSSKRRGRPPRPSSSHHHQQQQQQSQQQQSQQQDLQQLPVQQPTAPKLKIKIGNNTNSVISEEKIEIRNRIRPPKKRLATVEPSNTFNVEDLKRESMKFRKKVRKDLKIKHKKKDKSEKRRRKKLKLQQLQQEVQIVGNENPTKLIIRFGGKKFESSGTGTGDNEQRRTSGGSGDASTNSSNNNNSNSGAVYNRTEDSSSVSDRLRETRLPESNKKTDNDSIPKQPPLKLKLSRCQEGTGYIMKPAISISEKAEETQAVQPGQPPPTDKTVAQLQQQPSKSLVVVAHRVDSVLLTPSSSDKSKQQPALLSGSSSTGSCSSKRNLPRGDTDRDDASNKQVESNPAVAKCEITSKTSAATATTAPSVDKDCDKIR